MVAADLAEAVFAQTDDEIAKALLIEKGAALMLTEDKVGRLGGAVDALLQTVAQWFLPVTIYKAQN